MKYCTVGQDAAIFPLPLHDLLVGTQLLLLIQLVNTTCSGNFSQFNICVFFCCIFYFGYQLRFGVQLYKRERKRREGYQQDQQYCLLRSADASYSYYSFQCFPWQVFTLVSLCNFDTEAPKRAIETTFKNCNFAGVLMKTLFL